MKPAAEAGVPSVSDMAAELAALREQFAAVAGAVNSAWMARYGGEAMLTTVALVSRVQNLATDRDCWVQNAMGLQREYLRADAQLRGTALVSAEKSAMPGAAAGEAAPGKTYIGEIVAALVPGRVLQNTGRGVMVSHSVGRLDAPLWVGERATIRYDDDGRGTVARERAIAVVER